MEKKIRKGASELDAGDELRVVALLMQRGLQAFYKTGNKEVDLVSSGFNAQQSAVMKKLDVDKMLDLDQFGTLHIGGGGPSRIDPDAAVFKVEVSGRSKYKMAQPAFTCGCIGDVFFKDV
eukprot:8246619-Ditylum_brightwellii.AAC.1